MARNVVKIADGILKITFGETEEFTPVKMRKEGISTEGLSKLGQSENKILELINKIQFKHTKRGCLIEIPLDSTENIYGFGLQLKSFNQNGRKKYLRTNADPIADSGDSHAPVPFYVSTGGYGLLVDTARYVSFYCGSSAKLGESSKKAEVHKDKIAISTDELYNIKNNEEEKVMLIDVPVADGVDIYLFDGPDIKTAIQRYVLFSGGGCIPPMWGLGIWYRGCGRYTQEDALKLAEEFRNDDIPCDVFGLEPGWQSHSYSCSYKWDAERFAQSDKLIEKMDEMNYKLNLWEHVFVHPTSPIYDELKPYSGNHEVWNGLVPDLSLKEASDIFAKYHKEVLVDKGISGFKLDECDSSDYTGGWSFPNCSEFPSGLDGEQMHSILGILYQETLLNTFKSINKRTYSEVRASHALAAPYPFVLYSDLYDHKDFIRGLVNSCFTGLLWSPEVRQCDSAEDLIRRVQSVVLSPQALINSWMIPNPPWFNYNSDENVRGERMENCTQVTDIIRNLFNLRMSLIPYIYSSFARYHFEGIPPFRALVVDYPEDSNTYDIDDQYIMGDSILVAPVTKEDNNKRKIYLPKGDWYYFWSNTIYEGGRSYEMDVDINQIPFFIKKGSILPFAQPVQFVTKDTCFDIAVKCYGENCCDFVLYEDDGTTYNYSKGEYNTIRLGYNDGKCVIEKSENYQGVKYSISTWEKI